MSPAIGGQRSNALVTVIESERSALAGMLPAFMRGEKAEARFFEVAMALRDNDKLASCRPETIRKALYKAAQVGLPVDGVHASLIPYGSEATYVIGYMGYINVYRRASEVEDVWGKVAFEGEEFSVEEGSDPRIIHRPNQNVNHTDPDKVVAAYACARRKDTGRVVFMVLWKDELARLRQKCLKKAFSPEKSPWNTEPIEMFRKTPIIRLRKILPLSQDMQRIAADAEAFELGEREPEFEVKDAPKTLGELAKKASDSKKRAEESERKGNADDVIEALGDADGEPVVKTACGLTITLDTRDMSWLDDELGGKSPFASQTWRSLTTDTTAGINAVLLKGVNAGLAQESDGKQADKRWQYAALVLEERRKGSVEGDEV
jgi:recombination protein RecT